MTSNMQLLPAREEDSKELWEWRNHPDIRAHFFNSDTVTWEEHRKWFSGKVADDRSRIFVAHMNGRKIGVIRFDQQEEETSVSVNLNPAFLRKGLGVSLIKKGTEQFIQETGSGKPIIARIKTVNTGSIQAFLKAGYGLMEERAQEVIYQFMGNS